MIKKYSIALLLVSFCSLLIGANHSEHLSLSKLNINDGLSSEEYEVVFVDSEQYCWFGNIDGVVRYDGYKAISLQEITGSSEANREISAITEDNNGKLWFATKDCILGYDKQKGSLKCIFPHDSLPNINRQIAINSIKCDSENVLWLGTAKGLMRYNIDNDRLSPIIKLSGITSNIEINDILIDQRKNVWIAADNYGLFCYLAEEERFMRFDDFEINGHDKKTLVINSLYQDKSGVLCVGTWGDGIYFLNVSSADNPHIIRHFSTETKYAIPHNIIYSITENEDQSIWLSSPAGVSIIYNPLSERVEIDQLTDLFPSQVSHQVVTSLYKDKRGSIWLATYNDGIYKVLHNIALFTPIRPEMPSRSDYRKNIRAFTMSKAGYLLVGYQGSFVLIYDPISGDFESFKKSDIFKDIKKYKFNTSRCFTRDKHDCLWIGMQYNGLLRFNPETNKHLSIGRLAGNDISRIYHMTYTAPNSLWVLANNGCYHVAIGESDELSDFTVTHITMDVLNSDKKAPRRFSGLEMDNDGHLWLASFAHGLYRTKYSIGVVKDSLSLDCLNETPIVNNLYSKRIESLFKDSQGRIWVATRGDGIKYWDETSESFIAPVADAYIENVPFLNINEDNDGNIWATSTQGLFRFTYGKEGCTVDRFTEKDGLQSNMFVTGAFYKADNGSFVIGGNKGFNWFNPCVINPQNYEFSVVITAAYNNDKALNPYQLIEQKSSFSHEENNFKFEFSALDYNYPSNNRYQYKLEGLEHEWHSVGYQSRVANYNNLKHGDYIFYVRGSNHWGKWSEPIKVAFTVKQAPLKTWWAISLYILALASVIFGYVRMRFQRMAIKNRLEVEKLEHQKIEALNDFKLRFFTNLSHELLTPLSILKIVSDQWDNLTGGDEINVRDILERNVGTLRIQIKKLLQFRKIESGNMKLALRNMDIGRFIGDIAENYKLIADSSDITFKTSVPHYLEGSIDPEKLDVILNNLLSNAFKYNGAGGEVELKLEVIEQTEHVSLGITVRDTGFGIAKEKVDKIFDRFYRVNQLNSTEEGTGLGLALVYSLVKLCCGKIEVTSNLGEGTSFYIHLPISMGYFEQHKKGDDYTILDAEKLELYGGVEHDEVALPSKDFQKNILVIEDDPDLLALLSASIAQVYNVRSAVNGAEGLKIVQNEKIDLIISDFVMPKMDGITLCDKLRSMPEYATMPFILITADHQVQIKRQGYELGIDSIQTKPVNLELLLIRIGVLIKKRDEVIKLVPESENFFEPKAIKITTKDEQFMKQFKALVEKHIENPDLSLDLIQKELAVSHSGLYRKTKEVLGVTPNDFIKNLRLARAAQLLEADANLSISDVAFMCGYNDLSYFGVCFKKQYEVTPRNYKKQKKTID